MSEDFNKEGEYQFRGPFYQSEAEPEEVITESTDAARPIGENPEPDSKTESTHTGTDSESGDAYAAADSEQTPGRENINWTSGSGQEPGKEPKEKKPSGKKTLAKTISLALVFGMVAGGSFLGVSYLGDRYLLPKEESTVSTGETSYIPTTAETIHTSIDSTIDVSDIAANCLPSIVSITNSSVQEVRTWFGTYEQEANSSGSGIIIGKNDKELLIVTNYHVVSGANELSVFFSFEENMEEKNVVSAKIKGYEASKDLAVISVNLADIPEDTLSQVVIATLGDSSEMKIGEQVVAIGNAMGYGQSVTTGIISAKDRPVTVELDDYGTITNDLIQTDAAINFGNSGGALINMKGEVIGINAAKFSSDAEGMGYAIPITDVEDIIGEIVSRETRDKVSEEIAGYLGVTCVDVTDEASQMYGMPIGVYVYEVTQGSAADRAGIETGDIIVKVNNRTISNYEELKDELGYYSAGETISLVIKERDLGYEERTVEVVLSSKSEAGIQS